MPAVSYQIFQGDKKSLASPPRIKAIGGDNGTEFYLFFPQMPPGAQWVFPFTYGFMFPTDIGLIGISVDASQTPVGFLAAPASTKTAQIRAYDTEQTYNAGTRQVQSVQKNSVIAVTVGGNATATIIPAVAGQTITLFWIAVMMQSASQTSLTFRTTATQTGVYSIGSNPTYVPAPPVSWPLGFQLPLGEGLEVVNNTGNGGPLNGAVVYTQA